MELKDLRKLPMPKLRDLAKQETELQGVGGMEKEALIKAIAEAKGIAYDETTKDLNAIHAVKQDIRALKKQKAPQVVQGNAIPRILRQDFAQAVGSVVVAAVATQDFGIEELSAGEIGAERQGFFENRTGAIHVTFLDGRATDVDPAIWILRINLRHSLKRRLRTLQITLQK